MAAGYRVIAPDQRGYGGSDAPKEIESYDLTALTGDLVADFRDSLRIALADFTTGFNKNLMFGERNEQCFSLTCFDNPADN